MQLATPKCSQPISPLLGRHTWRVRFPPARPLVRTHFQPVQRVLAAPPEDDVISHFVAPDFKSTTAALVAECQLRKWIGASESRSLQMAQVAAGKGFVSMHAASSEKLMALPAPGLLLPP